MIRSSDVLHLSQPDAKSEEMPSTTQAKAFYRQNEFKESSGTSPTKQVQTSCSQLKSDCSSKCCIYGKNFYRSRCQPVKAARGGKRDGGGRTRGGGGGGSGDGDWPVWA